MSIEELIELVRTWQREVPPEQVRARIENQAGGMVALGGLALSGVTVAVDAVLAFAVGGKPVEGQDAGRLRSPPASAPPPKPKRRRPKAALPAPPAGH